MVIVGGTVVAPDGTREADVVVEGRTIAAVEPLAGREGIDATGCFVLPGGVDPHTHLLADVAGSTRAALEGGTTTALSFTLPLPGEGVAEAVRRARDELLPGAAIDVELHAYVARPDELTRSDVEEAAALGVTGIKLFTAYPELGLQASDRAVFETLRWSRAVGLPVLVHCENGGVIAALEEEARGRKGARAFADTRPPEVEVEAIARVLALAELARARVYVVHVSTAGGIDAVRAARARGVDVVAEVCAHHLAQDDSVYDGPDAESFLTVPPLRTREHVEALWDAVADGTVDTVGSDHAAKRYQPPPADDFSGLPYGLSGIGSRLTTLLSLGLERGIPVERLAELASTSPAKVFGLYPRKGAIQPGADADLVVWDPERAAFRCVLPGTKTPEPLPT